MEWERATFFSVSRGKPSDIINRCAATVSAVLFWTVTSSRLTYRKKLLLLLYCCQLLCGKYWYFMSGKDRGVKNKESCCFFHFVQKRIVLFCVLTSWRKTRPLRDFVITNSNVHTKTGKESSRLAHFGIYIVSKFSVYDWIHWKGF